eukprot:5088583-Pyramimonas_sp.AAC.1
MLSTGRGQCGRLLNSTCSWTGDLGTESGMWRFAAPMTAAHGEWIKEAGPSFRGLKGFFRQPRGDAAAAAQSSFDFDAPAAEPPDVSVDE